jgi:hypothetical protein
MMRLTLAVAQSAANGGNPTTISYANTPSAHASTLHVYCSSKEGGGVTLA